jgi:hypothetical protein
MKVGYLPFKTHIASVRLRCMIPAREMVKRGIDLGYGDVFIAMKHGFMWNALPNYTKLIFDVCDDHFSDHLAEHYRKGCEIADAITCNSMVMREIIKRETGRDATVISEPYESPEREPTFGPDLFWFGHKSNLKDLQRLNLPNVSILTNMDGFPQWTLEAFAKEIAKPNIVIIPTGKSQAKSENRMVESIRNGKYVCAEYLPAYEPFYNFFPCMDINEHIKRAIANPGASVSAIRRAQDYILDRYSPQTITDKWIEVIEE